MESRDRSSFTPLSMAFTAPIFVKCTFTRFCFEDISWARFCANWMQNVGNMGKFSSVPLSQVWLSLHWFSWISQLLNCVMWKVFCMKFHPDQSRNMEITGLNQFYASIYNHHWGDFHETHSCVTNFYKEHLYWISSGVPFPCKEAWNINVMSNLLWLYVTTYEEFCCTE
jgi:hypothetical protein